MVPEIEKVVLGIVHAETARCQKRWSHYMTSVPGACDQIAGIELQHYVKEETLRDLHFQFVNLSFSTK